MARVFLDTNILVYSLDNSAGKKKILARRFLKELQGRDTPVISIQVLQELYYTLSGKMKADPLTAKAIVQDCRNMETVINTFDILERAVDISILACLSFWDALIVAAAETAHCQAIYSEDLNYNQLIRGIRIINPFSP